MLHATLSLGCCCTPSPQLPWAVPDLDAVALQNSIVCPLTLLPRARPRGYRGPTSSLRISWHWE